MTLWLHTNYNVASKRTKNNDVTKKYGPNKEMILADSLSRIRLDYCEHLKLDIQVNYVQFSKSNLVDLRRNTKNH